MKKLFPLIPLIFLLAGCVQETTLEERQHAIQYDVLTENTTRALHSYGTNNYPESFYVWAVNDQGVKYFGPDQIKQEGNVWLDKTNVRYWPKEHGLSFYALVDYPSSGNGVFKFEKSDVGDNGRPYIEGFKVEAGAEAQVDLMYAMAENKSYSSNAVNLKFHHALSQIVFKAQNNTHDLDIQIKQVILGTVASSGTFTFPTAEGEAGTWNIGGSETKEYTVSVVNPENGSDYIMLAHLPADDSPSEETIYNLTGAYKSDNVTHYDHVLNLIPQHQDPWDPTTKKSTYVGAYFKLTAIITHIEGNTELYNDNIVIPTTIDWEPGKRYNYTFIFNPGTNGGYTDHPENPEAVLMPLKYTIQVDDFIDVDNNQNMGTGDEPTSEDPKPSHGVTVTAPTANGTKY